MRWTIMSTLLYTVLYSSFARPRKGKRTTFTIGFDFPISVASFRINLITDFRCNDGFSSQIGPFNSVKHGEQEAEGRTSYNSLVEDFDLSLFYE